MKLYMKSDKYEEKKLNDTILLIPKNNENSCILEDTSKLIWDFLYKPRTNYEIINHVQNIYKDESSITTDVLSFLTNATTLKYLNIVHLNIELLDIKHTDEFAKLLTNDEKLRNALGLKRITTRESFYISTFKWQEQTNSNCFTIIFDHKIVGLISISHIKGNTANVGYWVASDYWNMGICTRAFKEIIKIAKDIKIEYLSGKVNKNNINSLKVWQKYPSVFNLEEDDYKIKLKVEEIDHENL